MEEYYFTRLSKQQKMAYYEMKKGLTEISPSFYVSRLEKEELSTVYELLMLDHPDLFYCLEGKYRYYPDSSYIEMKPEYLFKKDKILEHKKSITTRIERICHGCKESDIVNKLLYLHDFLCQNVHYDKLKKPYSHQIIGPLTQGVGVCEGIAKSFKALCDYMNIYCICVICDNNLAKGIKYRHMWNVVKVNGKYYHIDCTFDGSLSKNGLRHDYFLIEDHTIFKDHEPLIYSSYPCDDLSLSYYRYNKQAFTSIEQIPQLIKKLARKSNRYIINYIGGGLNKEILREIVNACEGFNSTKNKKGSYSINYPLGIIECNMMDATSSIINEDKPNEGEEN